MILSYKTQSIITDEMVSEREKRWNVVLPKSFVDFIKTNNGAIPQQKIVIKEGLIVERFFCIVPSVSDSIDGEYDIDCIITKYDIYMVFDGDTVGSNLIPFAQLNHDCLLCLCYKDGTITVVVWKLAGSKEFDPNIEVLYESFEDFLDLLNIKEE